ncbi:MAG: heparan-alpha-glucosaminide N-acetyltransferase domain-containing protein, partial [Bdellovibrionales bacterium]
MAKTLAIHPLKRMPRSALVVPLIAVRSFATKTPRLEAVDLARGIAVLLMILSHGVKGLLTFDDFPDWGLVPVHLITKFSSTLFILVFGISLAVAFVPFVGRPDWPKKRRKLLVRGLVVLFWYKVLTIVEMFHLYEREEIVDTLLYKTFPSYVEILGFYALALLWIPFVLGAWRSLPLTARIMTPFILAAASAWLHNHFHFWGNDVLKALLVEHRDYYTWGQLARAPLIFL